MTPTTLVLAYYDNPGMWQEQAAALNELPAWLREHISVVVVDDGSPRYPAEPQTANVWSQQIYRMRKDVRWNQDACRNVGVRHAETNAVLLTDIDHVVSEAAWRTAIKTKWESDLVAYTFSRVSAPDMEPYKPHPNSWLMLRSLYDKVGGYDERFAGFYGTDADFRDRLRAVAQLKQVKEPLIRYPRTLIADASTTTYLRKQPEDRVAIARIKRERAQDDDPSPRRFTFEYDRVYPPTA